MTTSLPTGPPQPLRVDRAPSPPGAVPSAGAVPLPGALQDRPSRREAILDAAADLFREFGYYGASLRDISGRVGISHSGMLHYFGSKEEILSSVIDRLESHAQEALDRQGEHCVDPDALLRALVTTWSPISPCIQLLSALDADANGDTHPGWRRMARLRVVHEHVLTHCFSELAGRGELREDIDPRFAARAVLALVLGDAVREQTVRRLRRPTAGDGPHQDLQALVRTFLAL
jgi:AcrR family transcriptional regulator